MQREGQDWREELTDINAKSQHYATECHVTNTRPAQLAQFPIPIGIPLSPLPPSTLPHFVVAACQVTNLEMTKCSLKNARSEGLKGKQRAQRGPQPALPASIIEFLPFFSRFLAFFSAFVGHFSVL